MSNNLMAIQCLGCKEKPFYIGKYYPSEGWYAEPFWFKGGFVKAWNKWLEEHKECASCHAMSGPTFYQIGYDNDALSIEEGLQAAIDRFPSVGD